MQRTAWSAAIFALVFVALLASVATNFDFRAFYCAGEITRSGGSPYTVEPLHSCERALPNDPFAPYSVSAALPAPLPGYAIGAFVPFSYLPFTVAAHAWTLILCLAGLVALICIVRATSLPPAVGAAALLLSLFAASIGLGETVPLVVAALCLAAAFAVCGWWRAAAVAAAATMIEPHLGVPAVLALVLFAPGSRITLFGCAAALAATSIALLGVHSNIEYVTRVLPEHALSEIGSDAQLSMSVVLYGLGAAPNVAVTIATISYVVTCAVGIYLARILARELQSDAFLVLTPPAFAVLGGTFIHVTQMAAALPFALLLWSRAPRARTAIGIACALLAVPWRVTGSPLLIAAAIGVTAYLAWYFSARRIAVTAASAAATAALLVLLNYGMIGAPMHARTHAAYATLVDPRYAEASWAQYNDRYLSTGAPERWARRIPTWFGLILLCGSSALVCFGHRPLETVPLTRMRHAN